MRFDYIECGDCIKLLKEIQDNSIDLVVTDPPYEFANNVGGGAFDTNNRNYHAEYQALYKQTGKTEETERLRIRANSKKRAENINHLSKGFDFKVLDECCRVLKKINIYIYGVASNK